MRVDVNAQSATRALAEFAATVTYDDLSPAVVQSLKMIVLDTLGAALAATTLGEGCNHLLAVAQRQGIGRSTIFGTDARVSAAWAAMANGGLAHALNFDPITGHLGVSALTPALAVAEARGDVDGRTFLAAVAAAAEITVRLANARAQFKDTKSHGVWLEGQILGYFGAAAGAGRSMQLSAGQMRDAFGMALMQTAGSMQVVYGGDPPAKAIYGAFPNFAGVVAAELAADGLGGDCEAIDGEAGLFQAFFGRRDMPPGSLDGLGERFLVERVAFKPWPTSGNCHPFIEAALALYAQGVRIGDVEKIVIEGAERARAWCEPVEERRAPANGASAANSVPYCVAKAFAHGAVTLSDFTREGIADPAARQIANLITHELGGEPLGSARVRVHLVGGGQRDVHVKAALGTIANPMTRDQIVAKFLECASYASKPLDLARRQAIVEAVDELEDIKDMRSFSAFLA